MRFIYACGILIVSHLTLQSQVFKTIVVEHFTNTYCSICAGRNPGFYNNLSNSPGILHVAFHPSAPYTQCPINQQNKIENDERTKFYGVYGSTPRLVIQGSVISSTVSYSDPIIFTPFLNQPASISVVVRQFEKNDSIHANVCVVRLTNTGGLDQVRLFVSLISDTLAFTGANGESSQHDVFRKAITNILGDTIQLPVPIGDSVNIQFKTAIKSTWNKKTLAVMAIVQKLSDTEVLNVSATKPGENLMTGFSDHTSEPTVITCYPNPFIDHLYIKHPFQLSLSVQVYNSLGMIVSDLKVDGNFPIDLSDIPSGIYFLRLVSSEGDHFIHCVKE